MMTTRRQWLTTASVLFALVTVASCGGSGSSPSSSSSGSTHKLAGQSITMVGYGGATQDALASAFADPVSRATGLQINQDPTFDYAKISAQVAAHNITWDVVEADPFATIAGCGTLYEKVDVNLSHIDPAYVQGDSCGVPADTYAIVLMYDKSKFGNDPPKNWTDFFNVSKFPGKRGIFNYSVGGALEAALLADGVSRSQLYPLDVGRAISKLNTIKSNIVFYNSLGQSVEQLLNGDVTMSMMWNSRAYSAVQAGADNFAPVWQDALVGWDSWAIPKGDPRKAAAEVLLQYMATAPPQDAMANSIPFGPTVMGASPSVGSIAYQYLPSNPTIKPLTVVINQLWWSTNLDSATQAWNTFASG